MDEKVIEARTGLMNLYKGVYTANSGVGRQALARIDNTLANLRIRNNNLQEQLDKYKEVIKEVREYANDKLFDDYYNIIRDITDEYLAHYDNTNKALASSIEDYFREQRPILLDLVDSCTEDY